MSNDERPRMNLVLCWHMHQPWYRESQDGEYCLPWVYLHGLKDYVDMAAHLEAHPKMRCVVNFTPVLLEQLDDYAQQFKSHLASGTPFSDPLLNLLAGITPIPADAEQRAEIVRACRRAHAPMMIDVHARFRALFDLVMSLDRKRVDPSRLRYLNDQFFLDLLSWYHLAWLGHSLKRLPDVQALMDREQEFDAEARQVLLRVMSDAFDGLLARYAKLARTGQIELSMTPYGHPIVPLLIDLGAMHCSLPEAKGPQADAYPGGSDRARWHMREGIRVFERYLGCKPTGVWLSEGGVSTDALKLLDEFGIRWSASGEGVWANSRFLSGLDAHGEQARRTLFCSHQVDDCKTRMFFRDDGLSDMIGFEYQQWNAGDAAANFGEHLKNIARYLGDSCHEHVVSVVLDGENAWEYYPDNAFHFLGALYEHLVANPHIRCVTFTEAVPLCPPQKLPTLCPGSWVYGSFSTWIGERDKNRAWDLLVEAKQTYDRVVGKKRLSSEAKTRLERQLAICEGSDWFWWFGDYNPADSVNDFDRLYRKQLQNLYEMLGEPPPANLDQPLSRGGGAAENAGTMRRGHG
ncbi:MAG: glycoside hydrolase [Chromatiaceae bacterium]|nr:glycoside hydrolase [Chromatiaceae bacterium]MCP5306623.1 glycoside hydrolase [Chromatiaceae bacterium]MCP5421876.1 glycoside hydrolase [Chromatiaceae bacterium]